MSSVLPALNEHVRRLARREARAQTQHTKRASAKHRRDIAALKRLIRSMASRIATLEKHSPSHSSAIAVSSHSAAAGGLRFRKDGLRTHREKIGLSAQDYGTLIGVSGLTIYHWEAGKSKPRRKHLPAIAAVRALGKRQALAALAQR
ncbi:MAG TPA: helix-turn-helix domain-containing protein [Phycisphaerae bacterium]|jgi:DNA-binding transcriptional regulator YiaG